MDDLEQISQNLRQMDRLSYLASLLMDKEFRPAFTVLYAFNAEIVRIRDIIKEPLPGEIRLQWWREVTADHARRDEAALNPLARHLNQLIVQHSLNRESFDFYCRARIFDMYDDPMPDIQTYEGYAGETSSILLQMSCQIIDQKLARQTADLSGHGGIALSVARNVSQLPHHRVQGRLHVPLEILKQHDLNRDSFLQGDDKNAIREAIVSFAEFGLSHLNRAKEAYREAPDALKPSFLPLHVTERILVRAKKQGEKCLDKPVNPPQWLSQWDLWRGARRGIL